MESGVLTAYKGRYAGGIISIETQRGANDFHGRSFFYFRNQDLDSNDWFDNSQGNPRQEFDQYNYGVASVDRCGSSTCVTGTGSLFYTWTPDSKTVIDWRRRIAGFHQVMRCALREAADAQAELQL